MLENNEIKMTLREYLDLRDKCLEYHAVIAEIVRACRENWRVILTDDILNFIYNRVSDGSIIEEIEAIQDEREKEE